MDIDSIDIKTATDEDLEKLHSFLHIMTSVPTDKYSELHMLVVEEMIRRDLCHVDRDITDRYVVLVHDWKVYDPSKVSDRVLLDDHRIVYSWLRWLKKNKDRKFTSPQFVDMDRDEQIVVIKRLLKEIQDEMIRRGMEPRVQSPLSRWFVTVTSIRYRPRGRPPEGYVCGIKQVDEGVKFLICSPEGKEGTSKVYSVIFDKDRFSLDTARAWIKEHNLSLLEPGMTIEDITIEYVVGLDDKRLIRLWKRLVSLTTKLGHVNEPLFNAGIVVGTELYKRGLWEENKGDNILAKSVEFEVQEYPVPSLSKDITIEQMYEMAPEHIVVDGQPWAAYLAGRRANEGVASSEHDQDLVIRLPPDPALIKAIKTANKEWSDLIHVCFDPEGPMIGYSYPIYRYGLFKVPKSEFIKGFGPYRDELSMETCNRYKVQTSIRPFTKFTPLKAKSGWNKNEFYQYEDFYTNWASRYLDRGIIVQYKYDGRRFTIHKEGDKVQILTEDEQRDRSSEFPNVVSELLTIPHDFIIDTEMVAYDCVGKDIKNAVLKYRSCDNIPREDTAWATVGDIRPEQESSVVFHVHDLLYLDGKPMNNSPYSERFSRLKEVIRPDMRFFAIVDSSPVIRIPALLEKWTRKLRSMKGSEGIMAKVSDSVYPIRTSDENRTPEWAKLKNLKIISVMVWDRRHKVDTKTGRPIDTWMYDAYILGNKEEAKEWRKDDILEKDGKVYFRIGVTYGRKLDLPKGTIADVIVGRIREYVDKDGRYITWMFPNLLEERKDLKEPDTLNTARKIAKVGSGYMQNLSKKLSFRLPECEFSQDHTVCPLKRIFIDRRDHTLSTDVEIEKLRFPIGCPIANIRRCVYLKSYYYGIYRYRRD